MNKRIKSYIAATLSTMIILSTVGVTKVNAQEKDTSKIYSMFKDGIKKNKTEVDLNEVVRAIVLLKEEPAIKSKQNVQKVILKQKDVQVRALEIAGTKNIICKFGYLVNGFSIDIKRGDIPKLKNIPGVASAKEAVRYLPAMTSAKEITGVKNAWKSLKGKGEGTVVAVIDSGVDASHKDMKITDSSKAKLNEEKVEEILPKIQCQGKYYTEKIPYAYNYADRNDDVVDTNPVTSMHGMHVAGIVGANASEEDIKAENGIQGVAPECQILAMKVFSNKGPYASADALINALEDATLLGADTINMSLGSPAGIEDDDVTQEAVNRASNAGVAVVVSGGNEFFSTWNTRYKDCPDIGLIGTPATASTALSVASYENTHTRGTVLNFVMGSETGKISYRTSEINPVGVLNDKYGLVDCLFGKPEDFAGKELAGKIALIKRGGSVTFIDKKLNAQTAGAVGCIIYNNDGDESLVNMAPDESVQIPGVFIGNSDGKKLLEVMKVNGTVEFKGGILVDTNTKSDNMSEFSSWGPTSNLAFKPEITGIGGEVFSTVNNNKYTSMSGTSMSAPFIAGSQALVVQSLEESIKNNTMMPFNDKVEKANFIKNTVIATAKPIMDKYHSEVPYSPRRQGAGLIQNDEAVKNRVIISYKNGKSTIALKEIKQETSFTLTLKNYSNTEAKYKASMLGNGIFTEENKDYIVTDPSTMPCDVKVEGADISFDNPDVVVPANGETNVTVTIKLPKVLATEQLVEGFVRFESENKDIPSIGAPILGFYGNWSKSEIIDAPMWDENSHMKMGSLLSSFMGGQYVLGTVGLEDAEKPIINKNNIAISPNYDACLDSVHPVLAFLRTAKEVKGEIVDDKGNVVNSDIGSAKDIRKSVMSNKKDYGEVNLSDIKWYGNNDSYQVVPEGQYYMRLRAKVNYENATEQVCNVVLPIKVDLTPPEIECTSPTTTNDTDYILTWKASDACSGMLKGVYTRVNGEGVSSENLKIENGICSLPLKLVKGKNTIELHSYDNAANEAIKEIEVNVSEGSVPVPTGFTVTLKDKKINEEQATVTFTAANNSNEKKDVTLIMAVYDKDNTFLNFVCVKKEMNLNETCDLTGMVKLLPGATKVKCFVWDSIEKMFALSNVIEIPIK